MFAPPFRDPFNYNFDPLVPLGIDLVGAAMHTRFVAEGKPGVTMRTGRAYSTWWNGGLRTTAYFHNMIGILTETIGNPTPMTIPFVASKQLPRRRPVLPDRAAGRGTSGSRSTTRSPPTARCSTSRRATGRTSSSTSTGWARTRSSGATATLDDRRHARCWPLKRPSRREAGGGRGGRGGRGCVGGRRGMRTRRHAISS